MPALFLCFTLKNNGMILCLKRTWIDKNQRCCSLANVPSATATLKSPVTAMPWLLPGTARHPQDDCSCYYQAMQAPRWSVGICSQSVFKILLLTLPRGIHNKWPWNLIRWVLEYCQWPCDLLLFVAVGGNDKIPLAIINTSFLNPSAPKASGKVLHRSAESSSWRRVKSPSFFFSSCPEMSSQQYQQQRRKFAAAFLAFIFILAAVDTAEAGKKEKPGK